LQLVENRLIDVALVNDRLELLDYAGGVSTARVRDRAGDVVEFVAEHERRGLRDRRVQRGRRREPGQLLDYRREVNRCTWLRGELREGARHHSQRRVHVYDQIGELRARYRIGGAWLRAG